MAATHWTFVCLKIYMLKSNKELDITNACFGPVIKEMICFLPSNSRLPQPGQTADLSLSKVIPSSSSGTLVAGDGGMTFPHLRCSITSQPGLQSWAFLGPWYQGPVAWLANYSVLLLWKQQAFISLGYQYNLDLNLLSLPFTVCEITICGLGNLHICLQGSNQGCEVKNS